MGHSVELRGDISQPDLRELRDEAGASPDVVLGPRRPTADDIVVVPEGWTDPLQYARLALSPARVVLLLLAPPGLFGWPFGGDWSAPDPTSVPLDSIGGAEPYRAMAALGFELWADSPGLAEAALGAGVDCVDIGHGSPLPFPDRAEKTHDIGVVEANRWASQARHVASQLDGTHLHIPQSRHQDFGRQLARARVLVWPSRIEGRARIPAEARAAGTVPVALRSNRFAESLEEPKGVVVVDSLEEMPGTISKLLSSPRRLERLAAAGMHTAREEGAWDVFVKRVDEALSLPPPSDPTREARAVFGEGIAAEFGRLEEELERTKQSREQVEERLRSLSRRRSVRLALALARATRPWFVLKQRFRRS
jgi:glycosyltransferase involved in cell wall biosynthesis